MIVYLVNRYFWPDELATSILFTDLAAVITVAMVNFSPAAFIPLTSPMDGYSPFQYRGEVSSSQFPEMKTYHLKELFRGIENLFKNLVGLGYIYYTIICMMYLPSGFVRPMARLGEIFSRMHGKIPKLERPWIRF